MNEITDKLSAMENDGIKVTMGAAANWRSQQLPLAIFMHWSNLKYSWSADKCGAFSESIEFNNWNDLPEVLEDGHKLMMERIAKFLGGSGI